MHRASCIVVGFSSTITKVTKNYQCNEYPVCPPHLICAVTLPLKKKRSLYYCGTTQIRKKCKKKNNCMMRPSSATDLNPVSPLPMENIDGELYCTNTLR